MRKLWIALVALVPALAQAQQFDKPVAAINDSVIAWRRHFHQFPELSNREYNTGAYIAAYLTKLGLEVKYPFAKTGVVAILKGGKPGPVVALRADIDALPVVERVAVPFASKVSGEYEGKKVGVMHACGHDSHTSILMGTATVLKQMQKDVAGTVIFMFQPAEEGTPGTEEGGAPLMIKEGVMDNPKVDAVFGLHINSQTEIGTIKYTSGSTMASSDWFTVKVKGKQSHGSQPWSGTDPIVVASQIITGFQTIVSRQEELTKAPVVITVGVINAGVRSNQYPQVIANAEAAYKRIGLQPVKEPIRGGTDGSRLSFMGLPCPNLFTGMQAIHSKHEWIGVKDMQLAVTMLVELVKVWEESTAE